MENWKPIQDFEDYEVSSLGRVRRATACTTRKAGIILKSTLGTKYFGLTLFKAGKKFNKLLHILVAQAFVANPKHMPEVNHKDADKANCKASNLEWRSSLGNHRHAVKLGLFGKGVNFDKRSGKWRALYNPEANKEVFIGQYLTKRAALAARRAAVKALPEIL